MSPRSCVRTHSIIGIVKTTIRNTNYSERVLVLKNVATLSAVTTTPTGVEVRTLRAGNSTTVYSIMYVQNCLGYIPAS